MQNYLDRTHDGAESLQEEPLLTFFDFLCHEPTVQSLEGFLSSSNLSRVPYLKSLMTRFERHVLGSSPTLPTPHELFHKFYHINLDALAAANGEMLTFSNPRLSQRYGTKAQLNYTHYLKQHRSAYAVYYFLMEQLQLYGQITRTQLFHACETATQLALQHAGDDELVAHCVACCEMLDFDTQNLRSFLHLQRNFPPLAATNYAEQLQHWDQALVEQLQQHSEETRDKFPLQSYTALMRLAARNVTGNWPAAMLQHFAARNDWWRILLIFQYYDLPLSELQLLLAHFKCSAMGVHLLRALSYDSSNERQHKRAAARQTRRGGDNQVNSSQETMTNSSQSSGLESQLQQLQRDSGQSVCNLLTQNARQDLFAIILCSSNQLPDECIGSTARFVELMQSSAPQCSSIQLLKHCVRHQMPILAVLASTLSAQNIDWCWLLWLAVASGQWQQLLQQMSKSPQDLDYVWSLIRSVVSAGEVNALLNSFIIFQPVRTVLNPCQKIYIIISLTPRRTANLCISVAS